MQQAIDQGNRTQFSVIARLRQQDASSLSTLGIILEIQQHLKPYKCICNIAVSSPNFIIHLPTLELQLQILSCKQFKGSNYILDILPWCSEYITFDLPWSIICVNEGNSVSIQPQSSDAAHLDVQSTSTARNGSRRSSEQHDTANKEDLATSSGTLSMQAMQLPGNPTISVDFSYFMVLELKQFYTSKFEAFEACKETFKEMYAIARVFSNEIERAIKSVQQETRKYDSAPPQDTLHHVANFGADLNNTLWYISEEIFDLGIAMQNEVRTNKEPIDLSKFICNEHDGQFMVPIAAMFFLRNIAESMVLEIFGKTLLIGTVHDLSGTFCTQIWCTSFHHEYKTTMLTTQEQAEVNSVYRFLKYITNVLGYSVSDDNSPVLASIVSHINCLNASISELQLHINKVTEMIHGVYDNIRELYNCISDDIQHNQIAHVSNKINDLFSLLEQHSSAVKHGSQTFEHHKRLYRAIKFESIYPAKPDGMLKAPY